MVLKIKNGKDPIVEESMKMVKKFSAFATVILFTLYMIAVVLT